MKSRSYFNNVLKGRTSVTSSFVDRFIELLELKTNETKYFRALINYCQSSGSREKEYYFDQLIQLNCTPHTQLNKDSYLYYKEWYFSAVRALLDIIDFKDDYASLAKRLAPPITAKQAKSAIALLKKLGIITKNRQGFWTPTDKIISSGDLLRDAVIRQYQIACLEHAKNMLAQDSDVPHRNITLTASLSDEAVDRISLKMQQFKSETRSIIQKDEHKASKVYHINLNFFPMSQ